MQFTAEKKFVLKKIKLVSKKSNKFPKKKNWINRGHCFVASKYVCHLDFLYKTYNIY